MTTKYNTYYLFHDIINNKYYINNYINLKIIFKKEDLKFYIVRGNINVIKENDKKTIDIMNNFFIGKKYIYYSYDDDNNLYIIYIEETEENKNSLFSNKKGKSLLTIREIIKHTKDINNNDIEEILYIIDFENNEKNINNLKKLLEIYIKKGENEKIKEINKKFDIDIDIDDL